MDEFQAYISHVFEGSSVIDPNVAPVVYPDKWVFPGLYAKSQTDGILYWQVGFSETTAEIITVHGYYRTVTGVLGKLQTDRLDIHENLSGRNLQQQAFLQARKKYLDKSREGYLTAESFNASRTGAEPMSFREKILSLPMAQLAKEYIPGTTLKDKHFTRGVTIQPKLDGIRARIFNVDNKIILISRNNKEFSWLEQIRTEAGDLLRRLPAGVGLDSELYNKDLPFEDITSIVRTEKHKHPKNDEILCYIFDIITYGICLEDRIKMLTDAYLGLRNSGYNFKKLFVLVQTVIHSSDDIMVFHDQYVSLGYEGAMVRKLCGGATGKRDIEESWYKSNRNNNLLKVKKFKDEEGTVIGVKEGEGREKGLAIWVIKDNTGKVFDCRPEGSFELRRYWFEHANDFIGRKFTYKYFEKTEYGIPRFPIGKGFRDYE